MKTARLSAVVSLRAAPSGKGRRFKIRAYTGGKLVVAGFPLPVVVDLRGAEHRPGFSILVDHVASVGTTLGQVDEVTNDGRELLLAGAVTGAGSPEVDRVLAMADRGHQWEASIGAAIDDADCRIVKTGESVFVNGQQISGPFILAERSLIRETTVLPMGADPTTSVNLAAAAAGLQGGLSMTFEEWLASLGIDEGGLTDRGRQVLRSQFDNTEGAAPGSSGIAANAAGENFALPPTANAGGLVGLRAGRAAEHQRIASIERIAGNDPELCASAIRGGWTPEQTELRMLRASGRFSRGENTPRGHATSNSQPDRETLMVASLCLNAGIDPKFLASSYGVNGEAVLNEAMSARHRGATLHTVMDYLIRQSGEESPVVRGSENFVRAAFRAERALQATAFSGASLTGIFTDSMNKLLLSAFAAVPQVWRNFTVVSSMKNFRPATRYRMITNGSFAVLPPTASFDHNSLSEESFEIGKPVTYGAYLAVDRESMVNDDLSALATIPQSFGRLGAITVEKAIFTALMESIGTFFAAGNDNYLSGGGSALSIAGLTAAAKLFDLRTDPNGDPCFIVPKYLVVGPSNKITAKQLVQQTTSVIAVGVGDESSVAPNSNPHAGDYTPLSTPWLENENIDGHTTTGWGLFAPPLASAGLMEIGFLNGKQEPIIETAQADFTQLGIQTRAYFDFAVAMSDGRFGVWNAGA